MRRGLNRPRVPAQKGAEEHERMSDSDVGADVRPRHRPLGDDGRAAQDARSSARRSTRPATTTTDRPSLVQPDHDGLLRLRPRHLVPRRLQGHDLPVARPRPEEHAASSATSCSARSSGSAPTRSRTYGLEVGDIVSTESHIICGACYQCRIGDTHVCADDKIIGISEDGCFAEAVKLPAKALWRTEHREDPPRGRRACRSRSATRCTRARR